MAFVGDIAGQAINLLLDGGAFKCFVAAKYATEPDFMSLQSFGSEVRSSPMARPPGPRPNFGFSVVQGLFVES